MKNWEEIQIRRPFLTSGEDTNRLLKERLFTKCVIPVLKPVEISVLSIIMLIGIVALTTELTSYEEIAKIVVIPSMILLIVVTAYAIFKTAYSQH